MTPTDTPLKDGPFRLRILATTDLHMQLVGFDYSTNRDTRKSGLSRVANLISDARREANDAGAFVLLVDNGDGLQGTPLGDCSAQNLQRPHPLMQAFEHLRYDAIGLGNHDLDFGIETLAGILADAPCPVVCSNLHLRNPASLPIINRLVIPFQSQGVKIGVFSCLPPQTAKWNAQGLRGRATVSDILATARQCIDDLKTEGCDVVIALAHTGVGPTKALTGMENAAAALANLTGLDAVIAGHSHDVLPRTPGSGALVQPGAMGSHLGILDLTLDQTTDGGWSVIQATSEARSVTKDHDPALIELLSDDHECTRSRLNRLIGHSDDSLHSYFASIAEDRGLATLAKAQSAVLKPFLTASELVSYPILSAVSPARPGGRGGPHNYSDVAVGPISDRHVYDLCPFDNTLSAGLLTGAQVVDWLEMSAGWFAQIAPGETAPLLDPDFPGHNFDVMFGIDYDIDISVPCRYDQTGALSDPDAHRIRNVVWNGAPLDPQQRFVVAMTSYRASGGGNISALRNLVSVGLPAIHLRNILRDHFAGSLPTSPLQHAQHPWRFAPVEQATAIAETGPDARSHLNELATRGITETGLNEAGFLCLQVPLSTI